jgi:hypothetical protein
MVLADARIVRRAAAFTDRDGIRRSASAPTVALKPSTSARRAGAASTAGASAGFSGPNRRRLMVLFSFNAFMTASSNSAFGAVWAHDGARQDAAAIDSRSFLMIV